MSYRVGVFMPPSRADVARRIRDTLRDEILHSYRRHGLLPSESALMAREGASRTAVRLALDLLREEGLVQRRQGVGTVAVDHEQLAYSLDPPSSVVSQFAGQVHQVCYSTLALFATKASPGIARRLEIAVGDPVLFLERLTRVDDVPACLVSVWIPMVFGGAFLEGTHDYPRVGLFEIFETELGLELGDSEYSIEASAVDAGVAALLEVPEGSPILLRATLNRLADGRPVCFGYSRGRADRMRYEFRGISRSGTAAIKTATDLRRRAS